MKVVFVSNYLNHHQLPFSMAMTQNPEIEYTFIATKPIGEERLQMGYHDTNCEYDFIVHFYENPDSYNKTLELCNNADVVIIGSAPDYLVKKRIRSRKLLFRYSERQLKKGLEFWKYPYRYFKWHKRNPNHANIYMLCASAYASLDYAKFGLFRERCYKWGYFPEVKKYKNINEVIQNKKKNSLLWAGRFIDCKHPECVVEIARRLKQDGYNFTLNIIGTGYMEEELKKLISDYGLETSVFMLGSMSPEKVRENMENSEIFLFTSDRQEGWGAVLNESMNSGCAVVASSAIGSVPFLLKDGENGFIYQDGNIDDLYNKVKCLLDNPQKAAQFGEQAYKTLCDEWNAENAAERFICLVKEILSGNKNPDLFKEGICSKAQILKDNWYKK